MSSELADRGSVEGTADGDAAAGDLAAQLELLREENRRLHREYRLARRRRHRRAALGLVAVGAAAGVGAALFPPTRDVLLALAGIGLFAGLLVHYLTPERFIAADVGRAVYDAHARTGEALVADLGLQAERVYVPGDDGVRLFVPQHADYAVPTGDDLGRPFVVADDERARGVSLVPTGRSLLAEFERALAGEPAADAPRLAEQLVDALREDFELVDRAVVEAEPGRVTVALAGDAYGPATAFDHPVASFLAAGLADGLGVPVTAEATAATDDRYDAAVTCRWEPDDASAAGTDDDLT